MALPDLTGQNIQDTYQRVLTVGDDGVVFDGTGSLVPTLQMTASYAITEVNYETSSSFAETASYIDSTVLDTFKVTGLRTGDSTIDGDLTLPGKIIHKNDTDTFINFGTNQFLVETAGKNKLSIGASWIDLNNEYQDVNFKVFGSGSVDSVILWGDAEKRQLGIGTNNPDQKLTVNGNIHVSGSGQITASGAISASGPITTTGVFSDAGYSIGNTDVLLFESNKIKLPGQVLIEGSLETTHITASGYISASVVQAATYQMKGNNVIWDLYGTQVFGAADSQTLVLGNGLVIGSGGAVNISLSGPVTASSDISASGDVYLGAKLYLNNKEALDDTGTTLGINEQGAFAATQINRSNAPKPVMLYGNVTASGAISSSSNILGDHVLANRVYIGPHNASARLTFDNTSVVNNMGLRVSGNITGSGDISSSGTLTMGTNGDRNEHTIYGRLRVVGSDVYIGDGHITASGNISSSGDVSAGSLGTGSFDHIITSGQTIEFKDGASRLGTLKMTSAGNATFGDATTGKSKVFTGELDAKSLYVEHAITASGNISASGNIYADKYHIDLGTQSVPLAEGQISGLIFNSAGSFSQMQYGQSGTFHQHRFEGDITASVISASKGFIGDATGLSGTPDISVGSIEATSLNVTSITSSIVSSSILQTSGSNIFGDTDDDTHTFKGHITASGNISSSGQVIAAYTTATIGATNGQTLTQKIGSNDSVMIENGNITASGYISASSDIIATNFKVLGRSPSHGYFIDALSSVKPTINVNSNALILGANHDSYLGQGVKIFSSGSGEGLIMDALGNITASGDISSSGNSTAANVITTGALTTPRINGSHSSGLYVANHINAQGHITASGNIKGDVITGTTIKAGTLFSDRTLNTIATANGGVFFYADNTFHGGGLLGTVTSQQGDIVLTPNAGNPTTQEYLIVSQSSAGIGNANALIGIGRRASNTSMLHVGGNAEFDTHITASGNIKSDASVLANTGSFHVLTGKSAAASGLEVSGFVEANRITASAGITSSGNIYAAGYYADTAYRLKDATGISRHFILGPESGIVGNESVSIGNTNFADGITITGSITTDNSLTLGGSFYGSASGRIYPSGNSYGFIHALATGIHTSANTNLVVDGHISASGGITASGNIHASQIHLPSGGDIIWDGDTNTKIETSGNPEDLDIYADRTIRLYPDSDVQIHEGSTSWAIFDGSERKLNVTGDISASGTITANKFVGMPIHIIAHSWYFNEPAGTLANFQAGSSTYGWSDRSWNQELTKASVETGTWNSNGDSNLGVAVTQNIKNIKLIGTLKPTDSTAQGTLSYYVYKMLAIQTAGSNTTNPVFICSGSSATVGNQFHTIYITGSAAGGHGGFNPDVGAVAGDRIIVFSSVSNTFGSGKNLKGTYTVTAEIAE